MPQDQRSDPAPAETPPPTVVPVVTALRAQELPRGGQHGGTTGDPADGPADLDQSAEELRALDGPPTEHFVSVLSVRTLGLLLLQELIEQLVKKLVASHDLAGEDVRLVMEKVTNQVAV